MSLLLEVENLTIDFKVPGGEARAVDHLSFRYPWLMLPVVPVILTILAFNFLGDGLRDAADPYKN